MIKKSKESVIQSSKHVLGGEPVFKGTRVPVGVLIDYLEAGDRISDFLKDFPTVQKTQVTEVLKRAKKGLAKG